MCAGREERRRRARDGGAGGGSEGRPSRCREVGRSVGVKLERQEPVSRICGQSADGLHRAITCVAVTDGRTSRYTGAASKQACSARDGLARRGALGHVCIWRRGEAARLCAARGQRPATSTQRPAVQRHDGRPARVQHPPPPEALQRHRGSDVRHASDGSACRRGVVQHGRQAVKKNCEGRTGIRTLQRSHGQKRTRRCNPSRRETPAERTIQHGTQEEARQKVQGRK